MAPAIWAIFKEVGFHIKRYNGVLCQAVGRDLDSDTVSFHVRILGKGFNFRVLWRRLSLDAA